MPVMRYICSIKPKTIKMARRERMDKIYTILLVEDDDTVRISAAMYLEDYEFKVLQAIDGTEAMAHLKKLQPDVIVTDIRMPKMGGFEVIDFVEKHTPEIPIIVMSGTGDLNDVVKALRFGVWDFILKPIADMSIMLHSINKSIEKAELIEENKLQRKRLELANKELESFNYTVSHDLRSPLHAIDAFSEMLEEDCLQLLPQESQTHLQRIRTSATRMNRMIKDLLSLSRLSKQELIRETVNISSMATNIFDSLSARNPTESLNLKIEPNLMVQADMGLTKNIMENLIDNAWKYTRKTNVPTIEIGSCDSPHGQAIYVKDNGAGFSMKYYDKLFGVFQRLHSDKEFQGTGVGLATVQRIVQHHGGEIWAESQEKKGAIFYFTLPDDPTNSETFS